MLPIPFVPDPNSPEVQKLLGALATHSEALKIRVEVAPGATSRDCYDNVQKLIHERGGSMQLGWAVWQHSHLFIEGEAHAVWNPGDGRPWVDGTPRTIGGVLCNQITFVPNPGAIYDFNSDQLTDNVRVALVDSPRLTEALDLLAAKTRLLNTVSGIGMVELPPAVEAELGAIGMKVATLFFGLMSTPSSHSSDPDSGEEPPNEEPPDKSES